jgi:hypothetical protein
MISRFYKREALVKLSGDISWARYLTRFLSFPVALEAALSGSWGGSGNQNKSLGKAMAWAMLAYYPLEHLSYLKWQAPDLFSKTKQSSRLAEKASAWSCRFWWAYALLDLIRSKRALQQQQQQDNTAITSRRTERLQIVRNALFFLPMIHWSLPNWDRDPWLSPEAVNGLMWLESVVCFYQGMQSFRAS